MSWEPEIAKGSGPIYVAICEALAEDISNGKLKPSQRLPAHRDLAYRLGVTVGTVARAYTEASERGLVVGEVGRGTFINDFDGQREKMTELIVQEPGPANVVDLGLNLSAVGQSERLLKETLKEISQSRNTAAFLNYQPSNGMLSHRATITQWLQQSGFSTHPDNVVVCNGGQHGLLLSMMALVAHGETVATEALTYPGAKAIAHQLGIPLHGLPTDEYGLIPEALHELCITKRPKALYCMPVLQNPTTITTPHSRLSEVARIAEEFGLWIIEDDVYGFLAESRPDPLATMLPDQTVYISSASKSMAPGLRTGFLVIPQQLRQTFQEVATMSNWMSAPLTSEIFSRWIKKGHGDNLIRWHRAQAHERQKVAHEVLGEYAQKTSTACYHLWLHLPEYWRMDSFSTAALKTGVRVITADAFSVKRDHAPHAVRLCLGAVPSTPQIGPVDIFLCVSV